MGKTKFYKMLLRDKRILDYIKVNIIEKYFFKQAIKKNKSYLVGYPLFRILGKTTLIRRLAKKYNLKIMTRYHVSINNTYIRARTDIDIQNIIYTYKSGTIFLVDGIEEKYAAILYRNGYTLIGYTV